LKHYLEAAEFKTIEDTSGGMNRRIIIDGQQRITTLIPLLIAIRDSAENNKTEYSLLEKTIENDYLFNQGILNSEDKIRLVLTESDNEDFKNLVIDNGPVNYSSLKLRSLLLVTPPPVSGDSSNRNDWLVDFPLLEEGGYSLSLSGNAPQPDFRRGPEVYIPPPYGEHASETDVPNLTVLLFKRVPYHFRCGHRKHVMVIHKLFHRGKSMYLLSKGVMKEVCLTLN
jgi:hypothetical protein